MATGSNIAVSSIGTKISIALESIAGIKPTTGYKIIPKVRSLPDLDIEPDTYDTTSYDNLKYKSSIEGLIDTTGVQSMEAVYTELGEATWNEIVEQYDDADGLMAWIMIDNPQIKSKFFIPVNPIETGIPTIPQEDVVTINYRFTVLADIERETIEDTSTYYETASATE